MLFKKKSFFLTLLLLILLIAGCTRFPGCGAENENSEENTQNQNEMPEEITEIETASLSELKYHTRNIVLSAAVDNYEEAQNSLNYMKEQNLAITSALEDENVSEDLDTSLSNLQRALDKQDIGLIHIKAAIVMEELTQIMENVQ